MAKLIMQAQGMDGQIDLMSDRVVIHRRGIFNMFKYGINAKKEIPLGSISGVDFRDANMFKFGEITFEHAGRSQSNATQNTVKFGRKAQRQFDGLKEKIFELMNQHHQGKH